MKKVESRKISDGQRSSKTHPSEKILNCSPNINMAKVHNDIDYTNCGRLSLKTKKLLLVSNTALVIKDTLEKLLKMRHTSRKKILAGKFSLG